MHAHINTHVCFQAFVHALGNVQLSCQPKAESVNNATSEHQTHILTETV